MEFGYENEAGFGVGVGPRQDRFRPGINLFRGKQTCSVTKKVKSEPDQNPDKARSPTPQPISTPEQTPSGSRRTRERTRLTLDPSSGTIAAVIQPQSSFVQMLSAKRLSEWTNPSCVKVCFCTKGKQPRNRQTTCGQSVEKMKRVQCLSEIFKEYQIEPQNPKYLSLFVSTALMFKELEFAKDKVELVISHGEKHPFADMTIIYFDFGRLHHALRTDPRIELWWY